MSRILVTGGLGYIGHDLVRMLAKEDDNEIIIYDNHYRSNLALLFRQSLRSKRVAFVEGDILDNHKIRDVMQGIDCVVHLAAKVTTPFGQADYQLFDYINNWGTSNVVDAAKSQGVRRFIFLSSTSVYGHSSDTIFLDSPTNPGSEYARSKLDAERQVSVLKDSCETVIVRSGNTYGFNPSMRLDTVINNFMFKSRYGQPLLIHGDGSAVRGFIHVKRLAKQLCMLVLDKEYDKSHYLLCDHTVSLTHIVESIKAINPKTQYRHVTPERAVSSQPLMQSSLPGFGHAVDDEFESDLTSFFDRFTVPSMG